EERPRWPLFLLRRPTDDAAAAVVSASSAFESREGRVRPISSTVFSAFCSASQRLCGGRTASVASLPPQPADRRRCGSRCLFFLGRPTVAAAPAFSPPPPRLESREDAYVRSPQLSSLRFAPRLSVSAVEGRPQWPYFLPNSRSRTLNARACPRP